MAHGEEVSGDLQFVFLFNKRTTGDHCMIPTPPDLGPPLCEHWHLEFGMMELTMAWGAAGEHA